MTPREQASVVPQLFELPPPSYCVFIYGCFLKWWYPHFTPQVLIIFSRKTPWVCWGNPPFQGFTPLSTSPNSEAGIHQGKGILLRALNPGVHGEVMGSSLGSQAQKPRISNPPLFREIASWPHKIVGCQPPFNRCWFLTFIHQYCDYQFLVTSD